MAKELKEVKAFGTNYDIGMQIGKATAKEIKHILEKTTRVNCKETNKFDEAYEQFLDICQDRYPQYVEELKGMADGAKVEFRKVMKLNLPELDRFIEEKASHKKNCTTLILKKKDRILVAHNEDGWEESDIFLLRAEMSSGMKILAVCYPGFLPGFATTINSEGLFISCDSLSCNKERVGVPKRFITRAAIEAKDGFGFIRTITDKDRAQGQNYVMCLDGECVDVEVATTQHELIHITDRFAHANDFISPSLRKFEASAPTEGTFARTKFAMRSVMNAQKIEDMKKALSSHENRPFCVCSHSDPKTKDENKTLAIVLYDSSRPDALQIGYGYPCEAEIKEYRLNDA